MEELDFSKIFGETATSKASFTDENYISGWGYLGSTPPPYQLFDYLQGLNDKKSKYLYDRINDNKNSLLAHNADVNAHTDIRQKFNSYLSKVEGDTKFSTHNTDKQAHYDRFNAIIQQVNNMITKSGIQVITGEVANGGTIPLPDGFLESECKWFVGIKHSNVNEWRIDIEEGYPTNLLAPVCTVSERVVTVGTQVQGLDGGSYTQNGGINFGKDWARAFMPGTAWYMCIGIHR